MQGHVAGSTAWHFVAFIVQHRHTVPRVRAAHAARLGWPSDVAAALRVHVSGAVADKVVDLGLAEHFVHARAQFVAAPLKYRVAHGFTGTHHGF